MQQAIEGFRLSPQQTRLWHLQQHSRAYRASCSIEITGPLHAACLYRAMHATCVRHEIFRTRFSSFPGMTLPLQIVEDHPIVSWRFYDLRTIKPCERQQAIELLTHAPQEGSHLRCALLILAEQQHIFLLSAPSLFADRSTFQNFAHELALEYEQELVGGTLLDEEEEALQYLQFSEWQHSLLERKNVSQASEDQRRFVGGQEVRLPFMKEGVGIDPFTPAQYALSLQGERWSQVHYWLEQHTYTLPVLLLSCWATLLSRINGHQELYLAIHIDGREHAELAPIAGPLEKALPLSCQIDHSLPFTDLLTHMQQRYEQLSSQYPAFSPQVLPDIARDTSAALSNFSFAYGELPPTYQAGPLTWRIQDCVCYSEPFALRLVALRRADELCLQWQYHAGLFLRAAIQQIAEHLLTLLQGAIDQSQAPLRHLPLLSAAQRQRLLHDFATSPQQTPHEHDLTQIITQQARRSPDTIAVEDRQGQLSYQVLMQQAARLAQILRRRQIGPEQLVGVYQQRTTDMLISLLAIWQAGSAYVPLDPQTPSQRVQEMLHQAGVTCVLSSAALSATLPTVEGVESLSVEQVLQAEREPTGMADSLDPVAIHEWPADRLAYVIYTSGSTGQPKGVMISQQGLTSYVCWASRYYHASQGTGAPVHSPLAFDLTITGLFTPLVAGRKVFLVEETAGVEGLQHTLQEQGQQSLVKLTPAHLALLNQSLSFQQKAESCGALVIGGEALYAQMIQPWSEQKHGPRLINEYGPTETVVGCCIYEVPTGEEQVGTVPIGRPIPGTQVYVLDQEQQPVVPGAVGELYIGGSRMARGYLGQPELTAQRFIPHAWSEQPGARLYRTGDLVRYIDERGTLEYLGRVDRQVKLRGYRIELGDIESALLRHAQVQDAVVLLRADEPGMSQLIAYIVSHQTPAPDLHELRTFLHAYLPEYMIPTALVVLPSMPLTPNGKVDLRQLRAIDAQSEGANGSEPQDTAKVIVPPRDIIELQLLRLWEEVLHLQNISIVDDFFELGGHSMLALRLLALILKYLDQDITLATFFLYPTIADLAVVLRQKNPSVYRSPLVALNPQGSHTPFFCVHPSGGTVIHYIHLARHLGQDHPCYGLQATDQISDEDGQATIEDMATRYLAAIRTIQPHGPYLLGGWSMGGIVALEMAQQARRQGEQVALLALIDSRIVSAESRAHAIEQDETLSDETFARMMAATFKIELPVDFEQLDHRAVIDQLFAQAKQNQSIPVDTNLEQVRHIASITRKHDRMARIYEPQAYLQRIDYFVAQDSLGQEQAGAEEQSAAEPERRDVLSPWRKVACGGLEVHIIPGTHRLMIEEPNVQALVQALRARIDDIDQ